MAELEVAGGMCGASDPAGDVRVVAHLLAARRIVDFLVADVTLLRIFELINIARRHLHPLHLYQEHDQLRLDLLQRIE